MASLDRITLEDSLDAGAFDDEFPSFARTILDGLPDAVTVQDASGTLVYANMAASELVGFDSPQAMIAAGGRAAMDAWETTHEDGTPLDAEDLPGRRALAGQEPEPLVLRAVHNETGRTSWTRTQAVALRSSDGSIRYAVNLIEDFTESKRAEIHQRLLAEAGQLLSGTPDVERTLSQVAGLAVPDLAEWCAFDIADGRGGVRLAALAHSDPEKVALGHSLRAKFPPEITPERGVGRVLTGETEHYPEISEELVRETAQNDEHFEIIQELGMRSAIIVPVRSRAEILGVLTLVEGSRALTAGDRALAEELGRRVGDALATARLFEEQANVARTLQTALLPPALPTVRGWEFTTLFSPAPGTRVGGDFYDLFFVPGGWWLVIGDVAGRGPAAAALTSMVRYTMRAAGQMTNDLAAAAAQVNQTLREHGNTSLCSLAAVCVGESGEATVLSAGHPPPAIVRGSEVGWIEPGGPMLGAFDDAEWTIAEPEIGSGDAVFLYTDGVIEARGSEGRFAEARLGETLAATDAESGHGLIGSVQQALAAFTVGDPDDDVAAVCARRSA